MGCDWYSSSLLFFVRNPIQRDPVNNQRYDDPEPGRQEIAGGDFVKPLILILVGGGLVYLAVSGKAKPLLTGVFGK